MFVDQAKIYVQAGNGGKGCDSFYFRRPMRYRHRDGGDGGCGGDIVIKTDPNIHTLLDFRYRQHFKADSGKHGSSNCKRGKDAESRVILVPLGTLVCDFNTGCIIRDLNIENEQVIVARGGKGGVGNAKKKIAIAGEQGQSLTVLLELKLIADVGLVGYPNAGKSSLLNVISGAKSKVADFPFTTLSPVLGVAISSSPEKRFIVADIPGLLEGAHSGKGLGTEFLRHIERTKILLFLIDMAAVDGRDPISDYLSLQQEIRLYNPHLLKKPHLVVANKMDILQAAKNLKPFKQKVKNRVFLISCKTREGIDELIEQLLIKLKDFYPVRESH